MTVFLLKKFKRYDEEILGIYSNVKAAENKAIEKIKSENTDASVSLSDDFLNVLVKQKDGSDYCWGSILPYQVED